MIGATDFESVILLVCYDTFLFITVHPHLKKKKKKKKTSASKQCNDDIIYRNDQTLYSAKITLRDKTMMTLPMGEHCLLQTTWNGDKGQYMIQLMLKLKA